MTTEANLQAYLKKQAHNNSVLFFKLTAVGQVGFPDVMLAYKGRAWFVELKSPTGNGKLSPRQLHMISVLKYEGLTVEVAQSKDECDSIISRMVKQPRRPA